MHTCRPNDDESRNLRTAKNSGNVVEETVKEIRERKNRDTNSLIFNAPEPKTNLKQERVKVDIDRDIGDNEQKPRPVKVVMKDTNKKVELFKRLSNLRDAEEKYKRLSNQHDLTKKRKRGRKETPRGGQDQRDN